MLVDELELPSRSARILDLNLIRVRLVTNVENFRAYSYFNQFSETGPADYEIYCMDLNRDHFELEDITKAVDKSYRAQRFSAGYYLVHYFGEPVYLITRGRTFYVFGTALEKTVWPYFIKHILTIYSADHGYLHLKSAGFVQQDVGATLLCGRNGAGKTVFTAQACFAGARFLTNTHAMVRDGIVHGVPSSIRVRADRCFGEMIAQRSLVPHMERDEYIADPRTLFGQELAASAPVRNIVVADYDPGRPPAFERISPEAAESFLGQFSFAVTTYGLKDDLLAHFGNDVDTFVSSLQTMQRQLGALTRGAACYHANVDMLDPAVRRPVLRTLANTE